MSSVVKESRPFYDDVANSQTVEKPSCGFQCHNPAARGDCISSNPGIHGLFPSMTEIPRSDQPAYQPASASQKRRGSRPQDSPSPSGPALTGIAAAQTPILPALNPPENAGSSAAGTCQGFSLMGASSTNGCCLHHAQKYCEREMTTEAAMSNEPRITSSSPCLWSTLMSRQPMKSR